MSKTITLTREWAEEFARDARELGAYAEITLDESPYRPFRCDDWQTRTVEVWENGFSNLVFIRFSLKRGLNNEIASGFLATDGKVTYVFNTRNQSEAMSAMQTILDATQGCDYRPEDMLPEDYYTL